MSGLDRPRLGITFILLGMGTISFQDMLIKQLSGEYPLHQIVFFRSLIGVLFSMIMLAREGGPRALRTDKPGLHLARALLIVLANMAYFSALAVMPLGEATALFFAAPLFITLLSIPLLKEPVGPRRLGAVGVGFAGVFLMMRPGIGGAGDSVTWVVTLLPIIAAFAYALNQILTRKLGVTAPASAMAIYIQGTFIVVGGLFWAIAGDGGFAEDVENPSLVFLLRAWTWPQGLDLALFLACGFGSAIIGYSLSQAYRVAAASVVAPFEYIALPLALFWGWLAWGEMPDRISGTGILLILLSGVYVFLREGRRKRPLAIRRPLRRW